jgi:ATP-dependent Clp protease ATP-binding subunit ClpA
MFERFTQGARAVVLGAREQAHRRGDDRIGVAHLLLALVEDGGGVGARTLHARGVTADRMRRVVDGTAGVGAPATGGGGSPDGADEGAGKEPARGDDEALATLGIDLSEVRRRVEDAFGPGALDMPDGPQPRGRSRGRKHLPFTPEAKKVLELALREAIHLQHSSIGTEHLLLGAARTRDGADLLRRLGVGDLASLRAEVLDQLRRAG